MAAQLCRVCFSEQRSLCETLIARGAPIKGIVEKVNLTFGGDKSKEISESGLFRHKKKHMSEQLVSELRAKSLSTILGKEISLDELRTRESENLLATLVSHRAVLDLDINTARANGDLAIVSSLIGRRTKIVEVMGRLLGELGIHTQVNNVSLIASPDYLRLRQAIMAALKPFPEARKAVAVALGELGRETLAIEAKPVEVIDAESTTIESGGAREAEINAAPSTAAERVAPAGTSEVLTVIHTESFIDSTTTEREQYGNPNVIRLSR